jgi:hypothetical protein
MDYRFYKEDYLPTLSQVQSFELLYPLIRSDVFEIRELSKKKQDEPLNAFKVKIINKKLQQIKEILKNETSIQYLELLDGDSLPSNSDAVLLMSQFVNAMKEFEYKYFSTDGSQLGLDSVRNVWKLKEVK